MNFILTEENKLKAIALYQQKVSSKKLAEMFGCCTTTMQNYLRENGIVLTKKGYENSRKFSKEKELEIIKLYKAGMTQKDIAIKFNTFNTSIRRVLLRNNIIPRNVSKTNRFCKHNPFKSYKKHDEYSEYFLGMLLTDGCIVEEKNTKRCSTINLSLTATDDYIIKAFRDWASPKQKISYVHQKINGSFMASVNITNNEAVEWLYRKGNFKNKSYFCKIYCPITWNILRGIFDGDGGFHKANKDGLHFFICGFSKDFMIQVNTFLQKQGIKSNIRFAEPDKWHKNGLYYVDVTNYADVIKIGINMYCNAHIYLKRKYERWLTFYENKRDKYTLNSGKEMAIQS
jgi:transposase-like protein